MCALSRRIALIAFRRMQRACHRTTSLHEELSRDCRPSWSGGCGVIASLGTFVHHTCRARREREPRMLARREGLILMHSRQTIEAYASLRFPWHSSQMSNGRRRAGGDRGNPGDHEGSRSRSYGRREAARKRWIHHPATKGVIRVSSTDDARAAVRPYQVPALAGTHAGDACGTTKARSPGTRFPSVPGRSFQRVLVTPRLSQSVRWQL